MWRLLAIKIVGTCRAARLVISVADILCKQALEAVCKVSRDDRNDNEQDSIKQRLKKREPLYSLGSLNILQFIHVISLRLVPM